MTKQDEINNLTKQVEVMRQAHQKEKEGYSYTVVRGIANMVLATFDEQADTTRFDNENGVVVRTPFMELFEKEYAQKVEEWQINLVARPFLFLVRQAAAMDLGALRLWAHAVATNTYDKKFG